MSHELWRQLESLFPQSIDWNDGYMLRRFGYQQFLVRLKGPAQKISAAEIQHIAAKTLQDCLERTQVAEKTMYERIPPQSIVLVLTQQLPEQNHAIGINNQDVIISVGAVDSGLLPEQVERYAQFTKAYFDTIAPKTQKK